MSRGLRASGSPVGSHFIHCTTPCQKRIPCILPAKSSLLAINGSDGAVATALAGGAGVGRSAAGRWWWRRPAERARGWRDGHLGLPSRADTRYCRRPVVTPHAWPLLTKFKYSEVHLAPGRPPPLNHQHPAPSAACRMNAFTRRIVLLSLTVVRLCLRWPREKRAGDKLANALLQSK